MADLVRMAREFHYAAHMREFSPFEECVSGWTEYLRGAITNPEAACFIGEDEGEAVGMCTARLAPVYFAPQVKFAVMAGLWVHPNSRSRGIGGGIVAAVKDWAKSVGAKKVFGGANSGMSPKATGKLLRSHGFAKREEHYMVGV